MADSSMPEWIHRLERLAESQEGFAYPWRSRLSEGNGEVAYTRLVERHLGSELVVEVGGSVTPTLGTTKTPGLFSA